MPYPDIDAFDAPAHDLDRRLHMNEILDLEVIEIETNAKPGCGNSSSTSPRCTCPIPVALPEDGE
jgi:hypothetical protein